MEMIFNGLSAVIVFDSLLSVSSGANILGFLPFYGTSHNLVIMPLLEALARRGHNVTVVGFFEPQHPIPNYSTVLLKSEPGTPRRGFFSMEMCASSYYMKTLYMNNRLMSRYDNFITHNRDAIEISLSNSYDLVIMEYFESDLFVPFVATLQAPVILFHTTHAYPWHSDTMGDPLSPGLVPHVFSSRAIGMGFTDRLWNTFELMHMMLYQKMIISPIAQNTAEKHLGQLPPLEDEAKRIASLYFVNTHSSLCGPRALNPSTIEVGGLNVDTAKPLPEELKKILDNSDNGVIYFSMGSAMNGSSMSGQKRKAFLKVFSELKETVLWKFEEELPNKTANIYVSSWFPQRDIFAHPKMVLYMGHCGLLGTHEAVTEALPVVCIPIFGDQHLNAATLKKIGMGVTLNYVDISEETLSQAVTRVLRNKTFRENAKRVSAAFTDRPLSAMDTAIYWSEYVIRHRGAPHLKSPARSMSWWEYHNLDVLATLAFAAICAGLFICKIVLLLSTTVFNQLFSLSRKPKCA